jgi:chorismate mutase/prephenate dehydratase
MAKIAYLGPEQTYTHLAAQTYFGRRARYVHAPTIDDVFHLVEREEAEFGVVPVENSLEGAVTYTLDRFTEYRHSPVQIHGEFERPVQHYFISYRGTPPANVKVVYSHPQALAQCHRWLQQHHPRARRWETNSTADAVHYLSDADGGGSWKLSERAAIGRKALARHGRGLRAVEIPQERENKTRFLIIGLEEARKGKRNKTSLLFGVKDQPGALHDALVAFKRNRINMTKIESRPSKRKAWEYLFFVDVEGHRSEPRIKRALAALERSTSLLRVLGSYPVNA